jgi:TaqI-like C-terminal specificity domain/Eco57I restriction-modification methylase
MPSPELGGGYAAARVHHASRRSGGRMAARGACDSLRQEPREGDRLSAGMQIGLDFAAETIRVRTDLPIGNAVDPVQVALTFPRLEAAINHKTIRNEREWLITLQALFESVDVARRTNDPVAVQVDLRPYLISALSRNFTDATSMSERLITYADEVWKLLAYLTSEHGDGRFLKTLEDLVLGLVLKHDLTYDFVVGNPPYVRIQNLPERQRDYWAGLYSWAEGNYDIYVPFMERPLGTDRPWLVEGGRLGYVVSNSFLVTGAGEQLRITLPKVSRIDSITDFKAVRFADGNLFRGAMTYTCILVATRSPTSESYQFPVIHFYPRNAALPRSEALKRVGEIFRKLTSSPPANRTNLTLEAASGGNLYADAFWESSASLAGQGWYLMPANERVVFKKLYQVGEQIDKELEITPTRDNKRRLINYTSTESAGFAGVQTSLDDVMVLQAVDIDEAKHRLLLRPKGSEDAVWIEQDVVRPFLFGRDVWRWNIEFENWYVIFPYFQHDQRHYLLPTKKYWDFEGVSGRGRRQERYRVFDGWPFESPFLDKQYPLLFGYLQANERDLRRREQGRFNIGKPEEWRWYDLAYPRSLDVAHKPKIVAQLLARSAQFALDHEGKFLFQAGGKGGGVYGIALKKEIQQSAVLALLNSKAVDYFLRHITQFYNPAGSCSYADAFLKYLPIAPLNVGDAKSLQTSSAGLADLSLKRKVLLNQISTFPDSVFEHFKTIGQAQPTESLSNIAEISNLPTTIRAEMMSRQNLLDGRVSISIGRGTIWVSKDLADLIERTILARQEIDRSVFVELQYPSHTKDYDKYTKLLVEWQKDLSATENECVLLEKEQNIKIQHAYGITKSEMALVERFLSHF